MRLLLPTFLFMNLGLLMSILPIILRALNIISTTDFLNLLEIIKIIQNIDYALLIQSILDDFTLKMKGPSEGSSSKRPWSNSMSSTQETSKKPYHTFPLPDDIVSKFNSYNELVIERKSNYRKFLTIATDLFQSKPALATKLSERIETIENYLNREIRIYSLDSERKKCGDARHAISKTMETCYENKQQKDEVTILEKENKILTRKIRDKEEPLKNWASR